MSNSTTTHAAKFPETGTVDILFVTYGGGHCRMVIPVAKELEECGFSTCVFAMTLAITPVSESGLNWFCYADLPDASKPDIQSIGQKLSKEFSSDGPVPIKETISYLGFNFRELESKYGKEKAEQLYAEKGRFDFHPINMMVDTLKRIQPKVVVATNSPRSERAAINAAGVLNIPSLCMVDMFAIQEKKWIKEPSYGTKVSVLNDDVRDMLVDCGRPIEDICVTGNPAFDHLQNPETIMRGKELRKIRNWGQSGRTTILYASAPEPPTDPYTGKPADLELPLKVEEELKRIITLDESRELIIRRHPSENQHVELAPRFHQSTMEEEIDELLHAVDIVVVTCSTVGFQGYLAGRNILSVECSVVSKDAPYEEFGISRAAMNLDEIEWLLNDIQENPRPENKKHKVSTVRKISDIVVQLIVQAEKS